MNVVFVENSFQHYVLARSSWLSYWVEPFLHSAWFDMSQCFTCPGFWFRL